MAEMGKYFVADEYFQKGIIRLEPRLITYWYFTLNRVYRQNRGILRTLQYGNNIMISLMSLMNLLNSDCKSNPLSYILSLLILLLRVLA